MKKAKAKPVKGSARVKKFDDGGLAALAGLGALAYLMRKKKPDEEERGGGLKLKPNRDFLVPERSAPAELTPEVKRAMAASQGRPELIPEDADESVMRSDTLAKRVMPTPKPKARTASQTFPLSKPTPAAKATDKVGAGY